MNNPEKDFELLEQNTDDVAIPADEEASTVEATSQESSEDAEAPEETVQDSTEDVGATEETAKP